MCADDHQNKINIPPPPAAKDTAMTSAVMTTLQTGRACSTIEIKVNFIRPVTSQTGPVRSEARIIHVGSRIATAEGRIMILS